MKVKQVEIEMNCTACGHKNKLIIKADEKIIVENKDIKKQETCGKCERLAKIVGHPHLGYCIRGDCLVMLDNIQTNKNEHCFVPRSGDK